MKNKQLIAVTAGACLAMFGQLAIAKGPNYTYAEVGYTNIDGDFVEGDGASVNISYGATDLIFVKLGFSTLFAGRPDLNSRGGCRSFPGRARRPLCTDR